MKATLENGTNSFNPKHVKQNHCHYALVVVAARDGLIWEVAKARIYMNPRSGASRCYAAVWFHADRLICGTGHVGGYGYHKPSAALQNALGAAGIKFDCEVSGDSGMVDAMEAAAIALYPKLAGHVKVFTI